MVYSVLNITKVTVLRYLTNWIMIPIDFEIFGELSKRKIIYTRYADDMIISAQEKFPWQNVVEFIKDTLTKFNAPYTIKKEKTRFGSVKGQNWNLGLMCSCYNNNYATTIGYKKKSWFKSALCSFILDTKNGKYWSMEDVYHLRGQLSYYKMIEKEYFEKIIKSAESKWNVSISHLFKIYFNGLVNKV